MIEVVHPLITLISMETDLVIVVLGIEAVIVS
jgi:hypothetical protein